MNPILHSLKKELNEAADKEKAAFLQGYFKTGEGEYGAGDTFLGITVPAQRKIAKKHRDIELKDLLEVLKTNIHEYRFTALEILVFKYEQAKDEKEKEKIVTFYLKHKQYINNWDLVDTSARYILGDYLFNKPKDLLYILAQSKNMWNRRIAIITTHHFISKGKFEDTFKIAEMLLADKEDLIHKAVGWMLREVGNKDPLAEEKFLKKHCKQMPRTMLRYAIEKFPREIRIEYLNAKFS